MLLDCIFRLALGCALSVSLLVIAVRVKNGLPFGLMEVALGAAGLVLAAGLGLRYLQRRRCQKLDDLRDSALW